MKFKTTKLKSSLCDFSDLHILARGTVTVPNTEAADTNSNNANREVIFKNCASFTDCMSEISNTQVDNAQRYYCSNANA